MDERERMRQVNECVAAIDRALSEHVASVAADGRQVAADAIVRAVARVAGSLMVFNESRGVLPYEELAMAVAVGVREGKMVELRRQELVGKTGQGQPTVPMPMEEADAPVRSPFVAVGPFGPVRTPEA